MHSKLIVSISLMVTFLIIIGLVFMEVHIWASALPYCNTSQTPPCRGEILYGGGNWGPPTWARIILILFLLLFFITFIYYIYYAIKHKSFY